MSKTSKTFAFDRRALPSVDQLLRSETAATFRKKLGPATLTSMARKVLEEMRQQVSLQPASASNDRAELLNEAERKLEEFCQADLQQSLQPVINATGVILHTNLGRAPLSQRAQQAVAQAARYCTLEFNLNEGERGRRGARAEQLLIELTGAEDALVVNNCAAAALLILTVLAGLGETIVSRGELVEIGGDFRVPEVMRNSGTRMVEVGTTNRTSLNDYRRAINSETRLIMRVHPSNYRIIGFTASPDVAELAQLAHEVNLLLYEDAGSGVVSDLESFGLGAEPNVTTELAAGVDLVSFSGDKLLGSAQAGLIVGKKELVDRLRQHSLYRALRIDKLGLAALEATLEAHRQGVAVEEVPVLQMLAFSPDEISQRAQSLIDRVKDGLTPHGYRIELMPGESAVGGGSGPNVHPPTMLIAISHKSRSPDQIEQHLRTAKPPVVARIRDQRVLLDLRTVAVAEEDFLISALSSLGPLGKRSLESAK